MSISFKDLNLSKKMLSSLQNLGYEKPTEIQEKSIPLIMENHNLLGQAQTGTGKTLAFGIPIVEKINPKDKDPQALILTPTRELALQVSEEIKKISRNRGIFTLAVYGGTSIDRQINFLKNKKNQIVVGTPGRVKDLIDRGVLRLDKIKIFVLDEADRMLDMGFIDDIRYIYSKLPEEKQILLFSATIPNSIMALAKEFLKDNFKIVKVKPEEVVVDKIKQYLFKVNEFSRFSKLKELLNKHSDKKAIIFTETKKNVDELYKLLKKNDFKVGAIHGDFSQRKREQVLKDFKENNINILIATDVASRGLDIKDVEIVYNYKLPNNVESYIHRIGRTGRAGKEGIAISFATNSEKQTVIKISKITKGKIKLIDFNINFSKNSKRKINFS
ncbi:MAG: ATP-dependent helicase [Persephonella sp.]|nr:MAG: ATP-dependent helicase [Persephonella sp.]